MLVALLTLAAAVLTSRAFIASPTGAGFVASYPGVTELPPGSPVGVPAWLAWQHFLNAFFLVMIVSTGIRIARGGRPAAFVRARRVTPGGRSPRLGIDVWMHIAADLLWSANGVVFIVALAVTGQWLRIVPTSFDVIPNAVSALLQYLSLQWPAHDSWVSYNSLQQLSYFATVFLAAPLAAVTGLRLSPAVTRRDSWFVRVLPERPLRRVHFWVMVYFVAFTVIHVTLVFATGARENLNHMFAATNADTWAGSLWFAAAVVSMVLAWQLSRAKVARHVARWFGEVTP